MVSPSLDARTCGLCGGPCSTGEAHLACQITADADRIRRAASDRAQHGPSAMSMRGMCDPEFASWLRVLADDGWTLAEILDLCERPARWVEEFREWLNRAE